METVLVINALKLVGYGLATFGPGLGIGLACYGCCMATARQPELQGRLFTNFIIGAALAEALGPVSYTHLVHQPQAAARPARRLHPVQ